MAPTHQELVEQQFSRRAAAYRDATLLARGEELAPLTEAVAGLAARMRNGVPVGIEALDIGCGAGFAAFAIAAHCRRVVALDLSAAMLAVTEGAAAERGLDSVETRQGRAEALPFADRSFDLVTSRLSTHHWTDMPAGLREAARVLRPGGLACFIDGIAPDDPLCDGHLHTLELLRDPSHGRFHTLPQWLRMTGEAGLVAERVATHRVALNCAAWLDRMRTPSLLIEAIRMLQARAPEEVRRCFEIDEEGNMVQSVMTLWAHRAS